MADHQCHLAHGLPGAPKVAVLATRSIKKDAKLQALDMAVAMVDLTVVRHRHRRRATGRDDRCQRSVHVGGRQFRSRLRPVKAIWAAYGFHGRSRGN